jgi:hypothetical protein
MAAQLRMRNTDHQLWRRSLAHAFLFMLAFSAGCSTAPTVPTQYRLYDGIAWALYRDYYGPPRNSKDIAVVKGQLPAVLCKVDGKPGPDYNKRGLGFSPFSTRVYGESSSNMRFVIELEPGPHVLEFDYWSSSGNVVYRATTPFPTVSLDVKPGAEYEVYAVGNDSEWRPGIRQVKHGGEVGALESSVAPASQVQPVLQQTNFLADSTPQKSVPMGGTLGSLVESQLDLLRFAAKQGLLTRDMEMTAAKGTSWCLDLKVSDQVFESVLQLYLNAVSEIYRIGTTSSRIDASDRLAVINVSLMRISQRLSPEKATPSQRKVITQMTEDCIAKLLRGELAMGTDLDLLLGSTPGVEFVRALREMGIYESTLQSAKVSKPLRADAQSAKARSQPPSPSHQGVAEPKNEPDQKLMALGKKKAAELGYNPLYAYMNDYGKTLMAEGTQASIRNGRFAVVKGDMFINVGEKPLKADNLILMKGEYALAGEDGMKKGEQNLVLEETTSKP